MKEIHGRFAQILEILKIQNSTTIKELSVSLGVSEMTVRRDLSRLASENYVKLFHGGVKFNRGSIATQRIEEDGFYILSNEENMMVEEKQQIARRAASLVQANDVILLDTGSTTELVGEYLSSDVPLTVACYVLNVISSCVQAKQLEIDHGRRVLPFEQHDVRI